MHLYGYQKNLIQELWEGDSIVNPYYGHQATFVDDWKVEKRLAREEKVKAAQSYKRKNQDHPAFRR